MKIGILSVQGDFEKHRKVLQKLSIETILVKKQEDIAECDGLIIPGGESTTFVKLLRENGLFEELKKYGKNKPIMGTCAGLILLSSGIRNDSYETLNLIDVEVERNAYGRQIDSFIHEVELNLKDHRQLFEAVFIRAPKITRVGEGVKPIGYFKDNVILAENKNVLVATFHPELTDDPKIHEYFLSKIKNKSS